MTKQMTCKKCGKRFWVGYGADNGGEDLCEECVERKERRRETRIGSAQAEVLETLALRGGEWHAGCGWHWDGTAGTVRIMDGLARRSLLEKKPPTSPRGSTTYTLTASGAETLLTIRPNLRSRLIGYPYASPLLKAKAKAKEVAK